MRPRPAPSLSYPFGSFTAVSTVVENVARCGIIMKNFACRFLLPTPFPPVDDLLHHFMASHSVLDGVSTSPCARAWF